MRPIGIVGRIVLARLLTPQDFGSVALAMLFVESAAIFVSLGMESAVIHTDIDRHKAAFHAFVISTVSSVVMTIFGLANSELLVAVLGDPSIEPIFQVLLLNFVLAAWSIVPSAVLKKDLRFGPIYLSNILSRVGYLAMAIILAFLGFGVWSLVIANIFNSLLIVIILWWAAPERYWLRRVPWEWPIARSLLRYGLRVSGANITNFFASNVDDWLVGRRLGTTDLGLYSKSYDFTTRQINALGGSVVGGVLFPAYVTIRDNMDRFRRVYLKSVRLISTIMFPVGLGLLATAHLLIPVMLGKQWVPMTQTFQIFCILIITRPIAANTSSIFRAVGKPHNNMYANFLRIATMVPLALLLVPYGIAAVALSVLTADVVVTFFTLYQVHRLLPGGAKETVVASLPALGSALAMFVIVLASLNFLTVEIGENIWSLGISCVIGIASYGAILFIFQRNFTVDLVQTALKALDKKGRFNRFIPKRKPA